MLSFILTTPYIGVVQIHQNTHCKRVKNFNENDDPLLCNKNLNKYFFQQHFKGNTNKYMFSVLTEDITVLYHLGYLTVFVNVNFKQMFVVEATAT